MQGMKYHQFTECATMQLGWESKTYGPLIHDLEYNLRFVYTFGLFDRFVQWRNKSRSEKMIKMYESANKMM